MKPLRGIGSLGARVTRSCTVGAWAVSTSHGGHCVGWSAYGKRVTPVGRRL